MKGRKMRMRKTTTTKTKKKRVTAAAKTNCCRHIIARSEGVCRSQENGTKCHFSRIGLISASERDELGHGCDVSWHFYSIRNGARLVYFLKIIIIIIFFKTATRIRCVPKADDVRARWQSVPTGFCVFPFSFRLNLQYFFLLKLLWCCVTMGVNRRGSGCDILGGSRVE